MYAFNVCIITDVKITLFVQARFKIMNSRGGEKCHEGENHNKLDLHNGASACCCNEYTMAKEIRKYN